MSITPTIRENVLREFVEAGSIDAALVIGEIGGYRIAVHFGSEQRTLATSRGDVRLFSLETAARFLREIGFPKFVVDVREYQQGRIRKPRPDRAEALRKTRTRPRQGVLV